MKIDLTALVLGVLASGPMHGYGIVKAIRDQSGDLLKVGEGLLYPLLHRLEGEAIVIAEWQPTHEGRPPRKVYSLTDRGREKLASKREEWRCVSRAVEVILSQEGA